MIPIYEQGNGQGIGLSYNSFLSRFREICQQHLEQNRAKAFAFIVYDLQDAVMKKTLRNQGVFTELDRLSGKELSVFFLHTASKKGISYFNDTMVDSFEIEPSITPPFVVFVKFDQNVNEIYNLKIVSLEKNNIALAFNELYDLIRTYIQELNNSKPDINNETKYLKIYTSIRKFVFNKFIDFFFDKGLEHIINP